MTEIRAPEGKVLKAYILTEIGIRRGLVDHDGFVFIPGWGGWTRKIQEFYRIIALPTPIAWHWDLSGWWTHNWRLDSWSWCYGWVNHKWDSHSFARFYR